MRRIPPIFAFSLTASFVVFAIGYCRADREVPGPLLHALAPGDARTAEINSLIHQLASTLPPTVKDGDWGNGPFFRDLETLEGRDAERVHRAKERLKEFGVVAFPQLIAARDDPRFSYSASYAAWVNHSVGEACYFIIESQVDFYGYGYKARKGSDGQPHSKLRFMWTNYHEKKQLETWLAERKGKSLAELQIEALEWTIAQEQTAGFSDKEQEDSILDPLMKRLRELK